MVTTTVTNRLVGRTYTWGFLFCLFSSLPCSYSCLYFLFFCNRTTMEEYKLRSAKMSLIMMNCFGVVGVSKGTGRHSLFVYLAYPCDFSVGTYDMWSVRHYARTSAAPGSRLPAPQSPRTCTYPPAPSHITMLQGYSPGKNKLPGLSRLPSKTVGLRFFQSGQISWHTFPFAAISHPPH